MTSAPFTDDEHHFRGLRVPLGDRAGRLCKPANLEALARNNEGGPSGYYPIGLYQTWHNGIHLWAGDGSPVHALCDGRIVAACVGRKSETHETFGCRGFVLVRHTLTTVEKPQEKDRLKRGKPTNVTFFALYQHLLGLGQSGQFAPWLESMRLFLASEANPDDGKFVKVFGKPAGKKNAHQAIELRSEPTEQKNHKKSPAQWVAGSQVLAKLSEPTVVQLLGQPKGAFQKVRVVASSRTEGWLAVNGATTADLPGLGAQIKDLRNGGTVALDVPISAGDVLGFAGPIESEHPEVPHPHASAAGGSGVHLKIFSADRLVPASEKWTLLEDDTDADVMAEMAGSAGKVPDPAAAEALKKLAFDTSPRELSKPAARRDYFRALPPTTREKLRTIITRNASYWAVDWSKVEGQSAEWVKRYGITAKEKEDADRYSWWKLLAGKAAAMGLPASPVVHHYHPLAFLGYLLKHQLQPPVFYARIAGKLRVVERVGHEFTWTSGIHVWVHDPGEKDRLDPDWELGHSVKYKSANPAGGIDWKGAPDLYDFLLIGGDEFPPAPPIDEDKKRIWAAIHAVEGGLDSINCYDTAFLSFGPIQQTVGTKTAPGELGGALAAVKAKAPDLFKKHLLDHGLDVTAPGKSTALAPVTAFVVANGTKVQGLGPKERMRELYWGYLLRKAMHDEEFVSVFLEHGFTRIDTIRKFSGDFGGRKLQLGDIIKSELGQALVLDAHVNLPTVAQAWRPAVVRILGLNFDPAKITVDQERAVVIRFIYERLISKLNDPFRRTGLVLSCTKDCDGQFETDLEAKLVEYQTNAATEAEDALKATKEARATAQTAVDQAKKAQSESAEALQNAGADRPARKAAMAASSKALARSEKELAGLKKQQAKLEEVSKKRKAEAQTLPLWPHLKKELYDARTSLAKKNRTQFVIRDRT